jgi:hypothetical protein
METRQMGTALFDRRSIRKTATIGGRISGVALVVIFGAACGGKAADPARACLQFSSDLMPPFAGGLNRKDFRVANAWAVKADSSIDSSGVKVPAYFLSADIIAPNGEAVVGTWLTTDVSKAGLIYSVSPQAKKYTTWTQAGDASTRGISMETPGAKESINCVLAGRSKSPQAGVAPSATSP